MSLFHLAPYCLQAVRARACPTPSAYSQIIECRRVLSWTYTYGYYALEGMDLKASTSNQKDNQKDSADENHRFFFEFLQVRDGPRAGRKGGRDAGGKGSTGLCCMWPVLHQNLVLCVDCAAPVILPAHLAPRGVACGGVTKGSLMGE